MREQGNGGAQVYRCRLCGWYHVASTRDLTTAAESNRRPRDRQTAGGTDEIEVDPGDLDEVC